ncbi:MAG: hypothetical protein RLZZ232_3781, partial [Planctomycetota bacterium]
RGVLVVCRLITTVDWVSGIRAADKGRDGERQSGVSGAVGRVGLVRRTEHRKTGKMQ